MSELSETTGVAVPTLKYYLREGLLHAGERTSPNQARYDESHIDRVRLIRALIDVGGLPIARAAEVVSAIETPGMPLSSRFGIAQRAVTERALPDEVRDGATVDPYGPLPTRTEGETLVAELCAARGWSVHANNPGLAMAARVLDAYATLGQRRLMAVVDAYADAADRVASADLAAVDAAGAETRGDLTAMTDVVIVGTVLGDTLLAGLRRIAQEAESFRRFPLLPPAAGHAATPEQDPTC
ncbi:MAG: MerR family transcriptional regulator [Microcella sp.]